ncbi:MAG: RHS repeat-associated core domain-containing protein, partial [Paludibacteraceae bacterium]|nr:RHS repeat-associated core domain-containing protein [Paludibacteraceae bacterium]
RVISYIPYGEIFVEQQSGAWQSPYLFNAKELDSETGLYYYGARYFDPSEAMWLSVDPLWEKYVGMSPYGYCAGNPVKMVDPDGKNVEEGSFEDKQLSKIDIKAQRTIEKLNKKIAKNKNVQENKEKIRNLELTRKDISTMRESNENFSICESSNNENYTEYENGRYVIYLRHRLLKDKALIVHELRHCGQYARGQLNKDKSNYNVNHEVDAYRAQLSFNGKLYLPGILGNAKTEDVLNKLWDAVNVAKNHSNNSQNNFVPNVEVIPSVITKNIFEVNSDFVRRIGDGNGKKLYPDF